MKISELNEAQKQHLVWRLDHKTFMGLLTARRIARGEKGDLDLVEVFKLAERSDRSAKIHARKVINYAGQPIPYSEFASAFKLWETTKELLKLAAALNGETMSAMAHRLIAAEYKRVVENFASKESV